MKIDTIPNTAARLQSEGYNISEHALRAWIRRGDLQSLKVGNRSYLLYDTVIHFLISNAS